MKKVIVIGCPGSGKSTFSRKLSEVTGIPLFHLDMLYWNADGTTVEKSVFLKRLEDAMKNEEWIIDGNYASTMEMRIRECDTVFFLDYSKEACLEGIKERKGKARSDLPWIENGEDAAFIEFINNYNRDNRPQVLSLLSKYSGIEAIIFRDRKESELYISIIKK